MNPNSNIDTRSHKILTLFLIVLWTNQLSSINSYSYYFRRSDKDYPIILKKTDHKCLPFQPFICPDSDVCLPLQYLCDDNADCPDGYDEDSKLCTAAKRPPVDDIASFLKKMVMENGKEFLIKLFGPKASNSLEPLGGVERLAVALSESQTLKDFAKAFNLMAADVQHLKSMLVNIEMGDPETISSLRIKESSLTELKFFLDKLMKTGFLE